MSITSMHREITCHRQVRSVHSRHNRRWQMLAYLVEDRADFIKHGRPLCKCSREDQEAAQCALTVISRDDEGWMNETYKHKTLPHWKNN
ncbi:uncharacterized protein LOC119379476 isoform X2 [Rhipicephalus sanguineus]|uniref:uncharacterized protein LOC119379476 isoform X2 n=1 Tax=Rhipicephalus sanguineus TaxID=34632 RepID=UPI0020C37503|nr:uncharacterized protein LOC119379476 isoform X2 [Rhipicephalus sanguineus]